MNAAKFCAELDTATHCSTAAEAVYDADVIITVTPSKDAILKNVSDVKPSATIIAVGADTPGKQELDQAIINAASRVICDDIAQCKRVGELQYSDLALLSRVETLGSCVAGASAGRTSSDGIIVVDLTGVGAQDAAIAEFAWTTTQQDQKVESKL